MLITHYKAIISFFYGKAIILLHDNLPEFRLWNDAFYVQKTFKQLQIYMSPITHEECLLVTHGINITIVNLQIK